MKKKIVKKPKGVRNLPEVGKVYHSFEDGKITPSRRYKVKILEILSPEEFRKKHPELYKDCKEIMKSTYWLYNGHSDFYVLAESVGTSNFGFEGEKGDIDVFLRTKGGGWFSAGLNSLFGSGSRLDVDSSRYNRMIKEYGL